jgi:succinate dehydrogenase / fumarate reductase membrane anchor subunit
MGYPGTWVASPINAFLLILLTVLAFHHAASGMQAVFEDYIHKEGRKLAAIYGVKAICLVLGGACVFSILKIAFGHP